MGTLLHSEVLRGAGLRRLPGSFDVGQGAAGSKAEPAFEVVVPPVLRDTSVRTSGLAGRPAGEREPEPGGSASGNPGNTAASPGMPPPRGEAAGPSAVAILMRAMPESSSAHPKAQKPGRDGFAVLQTGGARRRRGERGRPCGSGRASRRVAAFRPVASAVAQALDAGVPDATRTKSGCLSPGKGARARGRPVQNASEQIRIGLDPEAAPPRE